MPEIEEVSLDGLARPEGAHLRLWFAQPRIELEGPPWRPELNTAYTSGFDLARLILATEALSPHTDGPVFVLVPEYTIRLSEVAALQALLREHGPSTVLVAGLEQLAEPQALSLENRPELWQGPSHGAYTNCGVVIQGGTGNLYLQPKLVPSQWETQQFWPGRVIRHFGGANLFFIVQICSDLLQQPASNASAVVTWLQEKGRRLDAVVWLQYNEKPRSDHFAQGLSLYCFRRATIFSVGSRKARPLRIDNYSVSGAVVHRNALSKHFFLLDKEFHYFEPVAENIPISRAVLVRYDADAHCVNTVLGDSLFDAPTIEKGTFFQTSQPFLATTGLNASGDHFHLEDLCSQPAQLATAASPRLAAHVTAIVTQQLIPLGLRDFLV